MAYIGKTIERNMYFGAKPNIILQARELRKDMTKAEAVLWTFLRKRRLEGQIFRRQHPIDIFIVDFYCHEQRLVIEVDGSVHDLPDVSSYDAGRSAELERFGLKVIRFTNKEVLENTEWVLQRIRDEMSCGDG